MTETEACVDCGVVDALDRHDPMCPRAIRLGLLRLAERNLLEQSQQMCPAL